ncbi:uncharacterized protein CLUP02_00461 [Colletotrichum lupini]|uniref:Uncharacterized protein n=1 Tax=Colletotrichum lupini TaxID=145971 RepID=A0A9Q8SAT7_9PEZI|nr:uncharacterized protein CLUP02_00461 [Colletotrichum lupini]UQC73814.1 hypothetical protein CLUP02_00461 [Colletotrichum lupini]
MKAAYLISTTFANHVQHHAHCTQPEQTLLLGGFELETFKNKSTGVNYLALRSGVGSPNYCAKASPHPMLTVWPLPNNSSVLSHCTSGQFHASTGNVMLKSHSLGECDADSAHPDTSAIVSTYKTIICSASIAHEGYLCVLKYKEMVELESLSEPYIFSLITEQSASFSFFPLQIKRLIYRSQPTEPVAARFSCISTSHTAAA